MFAWVAIATVGIQLSSGLPKPAHTLCARTCVLPCRALPPCALAFFIHVEKVRAADRRKPPRRTPHGSARGQGPETFAPPEVSPLSAASRGLSA